MNERVGVPDRNRERSAAVLAWLRLARVFQKVNRASSDHLRRWHLSVAQFDVLAQAGSAHGLTQQELADRLLVTKGNVTQLLDRLEEAGLLSRRQDGRANRICLTEAGEKLFAQVVPAQESFVTDRFAALSCEEQRQLLALLRKLDRALER